MKLEACLGNTKSGLLVYGLPEAIFAMYIQSQICTGFCYMSLILDINQSQLKTVERKKEERNSNFYLDKNPSGPIIRSCNVALLFKLVEKKLRLSCLNHGHRMPGYPKLRTATFFLIGEFSATLTVTTSV